MSVSCKSFWVCPPVVRFVLGRQVRPDRGDRTPPSVARVTRETSLGGRSGRLEGRPGRRCRVGPRIDTRRSKRVSSRASQGRVEVSGARSRNTGLARPFKPGVRSRNTRSRVGRASLARSQRVRIRSHEADVPTESDQAPSYPRIPGTDEDEGGPRRSQCAPREGPKAPRRQHIVEVGVTSKPERTGGTTIDVAASAAACPPVGVEAASSLRFRRADRLLDSRDFTRVLQSGRRRSSAELVVVTAPMDPATPGHPASIAGQTPRSRLGITVGRKAGPSVKRNRFKRRVREWFRHHRDAIAEPLDVVVIARRPGIDLGWVELGEHLSRLLGLESSRIPKSAGKNSGFLGT